MLDWLGLGTGPDTDPYLAKTNAACLGGDLAECFKSRALGSLDEFFAKVSFVRVLRTWAYYCKKVLALPFGCFILTRNPDKAINAVDNKNKTISPYFHFFMLLLVVIGLFPIHPVVFHLQRNYYLFCYVCFHSLVGYLCTLFIRNRCPIPHSWYGATLK